MVFLLDMVTDLIKIPSVKNLLFRDHLHSYSDSILNITSQNIIISYRQFDEDWKEIWVRYSSILKKIPSYFLQIFFNNIDAIQNHFDIEQEYQTIVVRLKSLETCYFHIVNRDDAMKLAESLNGLINYSGKSISSRACLYQVDDHCCCCCSCGGMCI